jgi:hypothetical protein
MTVTEQGFMIRRQKVGFSGRSKPVSCLLITRPRADGSEGEVDRW